MKKYIKQIIYSFLLVVLLVVPGEKSWGQEVSLDLEKIDMDLVVRANGDLVVEENHSYQIDYINGIYHKLDYSGLSIEDYQVGVRDPETNEVIYFQEKPGGSKSTYTVSDDGEIFSIRAYYPAEDKKLDFIFTYTLKGAVVNYNDTAQLNYRLISDKIDDTYDFYARVSLPGLVKNKDEFRAWAHGAPQGQLDLYNENGKSGIKLSVPENPANTFIELNTVFPSYLTPNNTYLSDKDVFDEVVSKESEQAAKDRLEYERSQKIDFIILLVASLTGPIVVFWAWYYYKSRKRKENPNPINVPEHIYSLPDEVSPAVMSAGVFKGVGDSNDFSATIVDLARKGYIQIKEVALKKRGLFNRGQKSTLEIIDLKANDKLNQLQAHELDVYRYITSEPELRLLTEMEEKLKKDRKFRKKQNIYWESFKSNTEISGMRYTGPKSKYKTPSIVLAVISLFVSLGLGLFSIIGASQMLEKTHTGIIAVMQLIAIIASAVLVGLAHKQPILTQKEDKLKKEWTGFKNMLSDVGNMQMRQIASLELWEEYLVYAISLGVADKVIESMNKEYSKAELDELVLDSYFYSRPYLISDTLCESIDQSLYQTNPMTYTGSNTDGFGGGFSGGSSGGSGGSSSGGF